MHKNYMFLINNISEIPWITGKFMEAENRPGNNREV